MPARGAAGGLGAAAVQIVRCLVLATFGRDEKLMVEKERFGADAVVNYCDEGWVRRVNVIMAE